MVEIETIRELVSMMVEHELTEMELRDGEQCVVIKRGGGAAAMAPPIVAVAPAVAAAPAAAPPPGAAPAASPAEAAEPKADDGLLMIRSPMVGTFYSSPDPDSPPFISIGSPVAPDTIVGVIEAMKVFNEIKAEVSGIVEQILVRNEQPLEYGQPMFLVRSKA